ncbi:hypothetical protein CL656_06985 [bacterium]|nr:hypothetical protein [bacterium]|tara:strand:+ start:5029 stop:5421 length:393 start_codon:yes stop_codon:yes gene_type:complete
MFDIPEIIIHNNDEILGKNSVPTNLNFDYKIAGPTNPNFDNNFARPTNLNFEFSEENPNQAELDKALKFKREGDKEALLIMAKYSKVSNQRLFNALIKLAIVGDDKSFPMPYYVARNNVIDAYIAALQNQ